MKSALMPYLVLGYIFSITILACFAVIGVNAKAFDPSVTMLWGIGFVILNVVSYVYTMMWAIDITEAGLDYKKQNKRPRIMGQGTDSCGGWDLEYDPVEEGLETGEWISGDRVTGMSTAHLRNAIRYAKNRSRSATFEHDSDNWLEWVDILETELDSRQCNRTPRASKPTSKQIKPTRGAKVTRNCDHCGNQYQARAADVKRGWGLSCSKRCAGSVREGINSSFRKLKGK